MQSTKTAITPQTTLPVNMIGRTFLKVLSTGFFIYLLFQSALTYHIWKKIDHSFLIERLKKEAVTFLARMLHQMETFMTKAFRDETVVNLPRDSNNAGHGSLRLASRVKCFQVVDPFVALQIAYWLIYLEFSLT